MMNDKKHYTVYLICFGSDEDPTDEDILFESDDKDEAEDFYKKDMRDHNHISDYILRIVDNETNNYYEGVWYEIN